jgi:hypothetical protein
MGGSFLRVGSFSALFSPFQHFQTHSDPLHSIERRFRRHFSDPFHTPWRTFRRDPLDPSGPNSFGPFHALFTTLHIRYKTINPFFICWHPMRMSRWLLIIDRLTGGYVYTFSHMWLICEHVWHPWRGVPPPKLAKRAYYHYHHSLSHRRAYYHDSLSDPYGLFQTLSANSFGSTLDIFFADPFGPFDILSYASRPYHTFHTLPDPFTHRFIYLHITSYLQLHFSRCMIILRSYSHEVSICSIPVRLFHYILMCGYIIIVIYNNFNWLSSHTTSSDNWILYMQLYTEYMYYVYVLIMRHSNYYTSSKQCMLLRPLHTLLVLLQL